MKSEKDSKEIFLNTSVFGNFPQTWQWVLLIQSSLFTLYSSYILWKFQNLSLISILFLLVSN